MHVVGDGDGDGVDFVSEGCEHFAVIAEVADSGECGIGFCEPVGIDVAEPHELDFRMSTDLFEVGEGHAVGTDGCHLEAAIGGGAAGDGGEGRCEGGEAGGFEEGASGGVHSCPSTGCVPPRCGIVLGELNGLWSGQSMSFWRKIGDVDRISKVLHGARIDGGGERRALGRVPDGCGGSMLRFV